MQSSRRTILIMVILAIIVICGAAILLALQLPGMLERRAERNVDLKWSLIYYCEDNAQTAVEADPNLDCGIWADQFLRDHKDIMKQCDEHATLDADALIVFSQCLEDAGAHQFLPGQ